MRWLLIVVVLVVAYLGWMAVLAVLSHRAKRPQGVVDGRLRACPRATNCVCSQDEGPSGRAPWRYDGQAEAAFTRLAAIVESSPRARIVDRRPPVYLRAEFRTPLFGFVDDFEVLLEPDGVIHYRSASRVGLADRGMNRRRLRELEARWRRAADAPTGGGAS